MSRPVLAASLLATLVLVACGSAVVLPSTSPSPSPTSALASPPPTTSLSAPTGSTSPAPKPTDSLVGRVVTTLADDGLRVRSQPRISDDSHKFEPLLPPGTPLYVLDGPVAASSYAWYEVASLASRTQPTGWVASAGLDGQPWIAPGAFDCPPVPTDFRSLAALPRAVGLACFARVPISVRARLISCNCNADGSWYTPSWFFLGSGGPDLLVEPGVTRANSLNPANWFALNLDPTGEHQDVLPVGKIVDVTGIFDHPAAANCTRTEMDGAPVASQGCRLEFAVTRLLVFRP
ncbi:MAG: hypothetical protein QOI09_230 [Chloroflexota bacterium]|nr:hypothetical protein [Chloroflexota bacterium]